MKKEEIIERYREETYKKYLSDEYYNIIDKEKFEGYTNV